MSSLLFLFAFVSAFVQVLHTDKMEGINLILCCSLVFILHLTNVSGKLEKDGSNVCSYKETIYKEVLVTTTMITYKKTMVYTTCGGWITRTCTRMSYRSLTRVIYMKQVKPVEVEKFYCCRGWTVESAEDTGCTKPICSVRCFNGGMCTAPNTCTCARGFEGDYCQNDINECKDPNLNNCGQSCINGRGTYRCGCKRGFKLDSDGKTCNDIDECLMGPCRCAKETKFCNATCKNLPGSFECSCPDGYEERIPTICEDRNECTENSSICDQRCLNFEGGYECKCFKGYYKNNMTNRCEDFNECSVNNGGCSHNCHNVEGGHICSCPSGFYLGKNRKTCHGIKTDDKELFLCEGEFKTLQCLYPKKIGIMYAMYGRLSVDVCKKGNYTTSNNCEFKGVLPFMSNRCDNQFACFVLAATHLFVKGTTDTCPTTTKYLHVIYRCV